MGWPIRALDPEHDGNPIVALWERALPTWPIPRDRLLAATTAGHVVEDRGRLLGAIARQPTGIGYLMVDPEMRRRGIGTALHDATVADLVRQGLGRAVLGWGGRPYIWPGIPRDLAGAERFFASRGWIMGHVSADLTQDVASYTAPKDMLDRAGAAGVRFALCGPGDAADVVAYEEREHPNWTPFFQDIVRTDPASILIARDGQGAVVAALLMEMPPRYTCRWSTMLGTDAAEIGCVGVAAHRNAEGIGTALMALATERVRDAGASVAYLSWTVRSSFYGRLGYRVWREYQMSELPL